LEKIFIYIYIYIYIFFFLKGHEGSCQYGDIRCQACGETMERRHIEQHRVNDCINRAVICTYCGGKVRHSNMKVGILLLN